MADNTYDAIVIGSGISGGWGGVRLDEHVVGARSGDQAIHDPFL